jgi:hypothetical protein
VLLSVGTGVPLPVGADGPVVGAVVVGAGSGAALVGGAAVVVDGVGTALVGGAALGAGVVVLGVDVGEGARVETGVTTRPFSST